MSFKDFVHLPEEQRIAIYDYAVGDYIVPFPGSSNSDLYPLGIRFITDGLDWFSNIHGAGIIYSIHDRRSYEDFHTMLKRKYVLVSNLPVAWKFASHPARPITRIFKLCLAFDDYGEWLEFGGFDGMVDDPNNPGTAQAKILKMSAAGGVLKNTVMPNLKEIQVNIPDSTWTTRYWLNGACVQRTVLSIAISMANVLKKHVKAGVKLKFTGYADHPRFKEKFERAIAGDLAVTQPITQHAITDYLCSQPCGKLFCEPPSSAEDEDE